MYHVAHDTFGNDSEVTVLQGATLLLKGSGILRLPISFNRVMLE